jgi:hypothetical protein
VLALPSRKSPNVTEITIDPPGQTNLLCGKTSAGTCAMQHEQLKPQYRNSARVAVRAAPQDNEVMEIAVISLAGLTLTLFEMAHYAGSAVLQQMFAL